jgi:hypothetical protein
MQKRIAAIAIFLLFANPAIASKFEFSPPSFLRGATYPCWPKEILLSQFKNIGMRVVERGLMNMAIDPAQPLIEVWKSTTHFAIVGIYPNKNLACSFLVGETLDGA